MNGRLPLLVVALALCGGLLWKSLSSSGPAQSEQALVRSGTAQEPSATAPESLAEVPQVPVTRSEAALPKRESPKDAPQASALAEEALWVEGRVVLPEGLPMEAEFEVVARGRRFGSGKERSREHRVRPDSDGHFRVAFAPKTTKGSIDIEGQFLYLQEALSLDPNEESEDHLLEPLLGGIMRGQVAPPPGLAVDSGTYEGSKVLLQHDDVLRFGTSQLLSADGHFEFSGLAPGLKYELLLTSPRYAGTELEELTVRAGEVTQLELALTRGALLKGRVVSATGEPLPEARLVLETRHKSDYGTSSRELNSMTDEEGHFEFLGVRPGTGKLTIRVTDMIEIVDDLGSFEDGDRREDLIYTALGGSSIRGVVTWDDGQPAERLTVRGRVLPKRGDIGFGARTFAAKTDKSGLFELKSIGAEPIVIEVSGRRRTKNASTGRKERGPRLSARADKVEPGTSDVRLVLAPSEGVRGVVRYTNGDPVGPFTVMATPDWEDLGSLSFSDMHVRNFDNEDGEFELEGLKPGSWEVSVRGDGFATPEDSEIKIPFTGRLEFHVERAATLKGVVRSPDGKPVAGAGIRWATIENSERARTRDGPTTDGKGEFELGQMQSGEYRVHAIAADWSPSAEVSVVLGSGEQHPDFVLVLNSPTRISGQIMPAAGRVSRRTIRLSGGASKVSLDTLSDEYGEFEFLNQSAGSYTARLDLDPDSAEDRSLRAANMAIAQFDLEAGGQVHIELGGGPRNPIRVFGTLSSAGSVLEGYLVSVHGDQNARYATRSNGSGNYSVVVDGPGEYWLLIRPADPGLGVQGLSFPISVAPGSEQREDFELADGQLRVTILGPDGSPLPDAVAAMTTAERSFSKATPGGSRTDKSGQVTFTHLAPGSYHLRASGVRETFHETGDGYAPTFIELEIERGSRGECTLRLEQGGQVSGSASNPDGTPAADHSVWAIDELGRIVSSLNIRVDAKGNFKLEALPGGRLTIRVGNKRDYSEASVQLSRGGFAQVTIQR